MSQPCYVAVALGSTDVYGHDLADSTRPLNLEKLESMGTMIPRCISVKIPLLQMKCRLLMTISLLIHLYHVLTVVPQGSWSGRSCKDVTHHMDRNTNKPRTPFCRFLVPNLPSSDISLPYTLIQRSG